MHRLATSGALHDGSSWQKTILTPNLIIPVPQTLLSLNNDPDQPDPNPSHANGRSCRERTAPAPKATAAAPIGGDRGVVEADEPTGGLNENVSLCGAVRYRHWQRWLMTAFHGRARSGN